MMNKDNISEKKKIKKNKNKNLPKQVSNSKYLEDDNSKTHKFQNSRCDCSPGPGTQISTGTGQSLRAGARTTPAASLSHPGPLLQSEHHHVDDSINQSIDTNVYTNYRPLDYREPITTQWNKMELKWPQRAGPW